MEPARGESFPRANVEVASYTGRIRPHPRIRNSSISLNLQQTRDQDVDPTGRYCPTRCGNPQLTVTRLLIGVREACGPHPMGARSSASSLTVIEYCTPTCCSSHGVLIVVRATWINMYDLCSAQPNKKKYGARSASIFALVSSTTSNHIKNIMAPGGRRCGITEYVLV